MPKKIIKRLMPNPNTFKEHKNLQFLGDRLHEPNLWHLNRLSVSRAFAIGLFAAWIPLPGQMAIAAVAAFYFRANLPISVVLVWISNPITMPPLFYFAYQVGLWGLDMPAPVAEFELSLNGAMNFLWDNWQPFLFGCLIMGVICSAVGYAGIRMFWRMHVLKQWEKRKDR